MPLVSAIAAGAVLVALAIPAFGIHTANSGIDSFPRNIEVMKVYDRMQAAFPGNEIPATVVVHAKDVRDGEDPGGARGPQEARAGDRPHGRAGLVQHELGPPGRPAVDPDPGQRQRRRLQRAVDDLRDTIVPATVGKVSGTEAFVTGYTAGSRDWNDLMKSRAPIVFAFVLTLAFMLLLLTFRSIVIPIKAIVLNLLSVGAAYGVLVEVFQKGHGASLLGFKSQGYVTAWLPMFLFVVLFGLSMDYHVFILSRIREAFDKGMKTEDAVAHGIKSTAGVVTSAAAVMVAVFAIFATLSAIDFKMMGVGLATAILIDATIVRAVLLPATMKLLGDWNWYLPKQAQLAAAVGGEHAPAPVPRGRHPLRLDVLVAMEHVVRVPGALERLEPGQLLAVRRLRALLTFGAHEVGVHGARAELVEPGADVADPREVGLVVGRVLPAADDVQRVAARCGRRTRSSTRRRGRLRRRGRGRGSRIARQRRRQVGRHDRGDRLGRHARQVARRACSNARPSGTAGRSASSAPRTGSARRGPRSASPPRGSAPAASRPRRGRRSGRRSRRRSACRGPPRAGTAPAARQARWRTR